MKRIILPIILLCFISNYAVAQYQWELGTFIGISNYQGDMVRSNAPLFGEGNFAFGIQSRYVVNYKWAFRGHITAGKISGSDFNDMDDVINARGLEFTNKVKNIGIVLEYEPFGDKRYLADVGFKKTISPYIYTGVGMLTTNLNLDASKAPASYATVLASDANASYYKTRFSIPFGIGLKLDLSEYWVISADVAMLYPFTDYLDGVSIAGNPDSNDWMNFAGVSVFYRLKESMKNK